MGKLEYQKLIQNPKSLEMDDSLRSGRFQDINNSELSLTFESDAETYKPNDVRFLGMNEDVKQVMKYLIRDKRKCPTLKLAWNKAKDLLIKQQDIIGTKDYISCIKVAICSYTLENPPFYRLFNSECRKLTKDTWEKFPYRSIWIMFRHASRYREIKNNPFINGYHTLYRGIRCYIPLPKVGDQVYSKQYLSFSIHKDIAYNFFGSNSLSKEITLIELNGRPRTGKGIADYSINKKEAEVLITPFEYFKVIEIDITSDVHKIVLEAEWE